MLSRGMTKKDCTTFVAAMYEALPDCEAVTVTVPQSVNVRMLPFNTAGPETEKVTGRPESAVASSENGASPTFC